MTLSTKHFKINFLEQSRIQYGEFNIAEVVNY